MPTQNITNDEALDAVRDVLIEPDLDAGSTLQAAEDQIDGLKTGRLTNNHSTINTSQNCPPAPSPFALCSFQAPFCFLRGITENTTKSMSQI
jgi:hypothetical protein